MALQFGSGEPVARLRRSLDVKGKVNLGVDDIIVPTIQLHDAEQAPFRKTGVRWHLQLDLPGVALEVGRVRLMNPTAIDQILDRVVFTANGSVHVFSIGAGAPGVAGGTPVRTTELMRVPAAVGGSIISRNLPINAFVDSTLASADSQFFYEFLALANTSVDADNLEIVLPAFPDPENGPVTDIPTLTFESSIVNQGWAISFSGRYWDSLPLNVQT